MVLIPSRSGRRYSDRQEHVRLPRSPDCPHALKPLKEREVTVETLPNGTVITTYMEQPLPPLLDAEPDPFEAPPPPVFRSPRPQPPSENRFDRWAI